MTTSGEVHKDRVHQVVLRKHSVSCLCRAVLGKHTRNPAGEYYEPIKVNTDQTWTNAYNKPENHFAPFGDKDKISE